MGPGNIPRKAAGYSHVCFDFGGHLTSFNSLPWRSGAINLGTVERCESGRIEAAFVTSSCPACPGPIQSRRVPPRAKHVNHDATKQPSFTNSRWSLPGPLGSRCFFHLSDLVIEEVQLDFQRMEVISLFHRLQRPGQSCEGPWFASNIRILTSFKRRANSLDH
jgi:hypothetical protein